MTAVRRALLSVHDKTGLVDFARGLHELGWSLVASGQTSAALEHAGIAHEQVADVTGSPEMLGGRVKTLHPRIHGGILADRSEPSHLDDLRRHHIDPIDLVVSNLYPFSSEPSIEMIDVGGPTMVRAAAKNHAHVAIITSPDDYAPVLAELRAHGAISDDTRRSLARKAFANTAAYDATIVSWFDDEDLGRTASAMTTDDAAATVGFPDTLHLTLRRQEILRYGENPHQRGARYRLGENAWWEGVTLLAGNAMSYLNVFDTDAAWRLVHEMSADHPGRHAVAIMKHANACGAAIAADPIEAYRKALDCDELSAFGGIVAIADTVTATLAEVIAAGPMADVIVAPSFDEAAVERLERKRKATRLLAAPAPEPIRLQIRALGETVLVQQADVFEVSPGDWTVATKAAPTQAQWEDMKLAWRVCARTTSNAIAIAGDGQAIGVGAGQQSRVVAAEIAAAKAGTRAKGAAAASDAFFPFPDGLEVLIRAGVTAVVQPGGSVKDSVITEVADEAGIVMVMTGERHFRH